MCGLIRFRALSDLQFPVPDLRDDQVEPRDKVKMNPLPAEREKFLTWSRDAFPEMPEDVRHLLALCKYVCDLNASNYMMSNKQKLVLSMLADGHAWRAHHRQIFHYEDGAWVRTSSLVMGGMGCLPRPRRLIHPAGLEPGDRKRDSSLVMVGRECLHHGHHTESDAQRPRCLERTQIHREAEQ